MSSFMNSPLEDSQLLQSEGENELKTIIKKWKRYWWQFSTCNPSTNWRQKWRLVEEKLKSRQSRHLYSKVILAVIRPAEMLSNQVALLPPDNDNGTLDIHSNHLAYVSAEWKHPPEVFSNVIVNFQLTCLSPPACPENIRLRNICVHLASVNAFS